jgi:hypothetical protein
VTFGVHQLQLIAVLSFKIISFQRKLTQVSWSYLNAAVLFSGLEKTVLT